MGFLSVLSQAQRWVKERAGPGDCVVDATAGNGSDTLFLAQSVGPRGRVFAFDVQAEALENTRRRLEGEPDVKALAPAKLVLAGHETMEAALPAEPASAPATASPIRPIRLDAVEGFAMLSFLNGCRAAFSFP